MYAMTSLPRMTKVSGGNITPARILALSATAETVVQASVVTVPLIGVCINAFKYPYGSVQQVASPYAFVSGDVVSYYGQGDICWVEAGAAITDLRVPLTTDGSGRAITATTIVGTATTETYTIGLPNRACEAAGELIEVLIDLKHFPAVAT